MGFSHVIHGKKLKNKGARTTADGGDELSSGGSVIFITSRPTPAWRNFRDFFDSHVFCVMLFFQLRRVNYGAGNGRKHKILQPTLRKSHRRRRRLTKTVTIRRQNTISPVKIAPSHHVLGRRRRCRGESEKVSVFGVFLRGFYWFFSCRSALGEGEERVSYAKLLTDEEIVPKSLTFTEASKCLHMLGKDESGIRYAYLMITAVEK